MPADRLAEAECAIQVANHISDQVRDLIPRYVENAGIQRYDLVCSKLEHVPQHMVSIVCERLSALLGIECGAGVVRSDVPDRNCPARQDSIPVRHKLSELIALNDTFRRADVPDGDGSGLCVMDDIPWDSRVNATGYATLVPTDWNNKRTAVRFNTAQYVLDHVFGLGPLFDSQYCGSVVAAGSAVTAAILGLSFSPGDVDLFVIEPDESRRQEIFNEMPKLLGCERGSMCKGLMSMYNYKLGIKYQLILRTYGSVSAILHAFDLPSSSTAYDGQQIYMTQLAAYTLRNRLNVCNPMYCSTTFESRMQKYMTYGFGVQFVGLSADHMANANILELYGGIVWLDSKPGSHVRTGIIIPKIARGSDYEIVPPARTQYAPLYGMVKSIRKAIDEGTISSVFPKFTAAHECGGILDYSKMYDAESILEGLNSVGDHIVHQMNKNQMLDIKHMKLLGLSNAHIANCIIDMTSHPFDEIIALICAEQSRVLYDSLKSVPAQDLWVREDPGSQRNIWTASRHPIQLNVDQYYIGHVAPLSSTKHRIKPNELPNVNFCVSCYRTADLPWRNTDCIHGRAYEQGDCRCWGVLCADCTECRLCDARE